MTYAWFSLIPPFITLACTLITKRVAPSLLLGIFASSLILFNYSILYALRFTIERIWENSQLGNLLTWTNNFNTLYTFGFLFVIGIIVSLISHTGGTQAYSEKIKSYVSDKRSVETSSILLSLVLFIDDYLNCLTVGCTMRPLADKYGIARVKLAYLINSMAVPWVILIPISSWVAVISNMIEKAGISDTSKTVLISADPFYAYIRIIPYIFYSFLTITSVLIIVRFRLSFGPMHTHEQITLERENHDNRNEQLTIIHPEYIANASSIQEFILPIASLLILFVIGLLYSGNYYIFGGKNNLLQAIQEANFFPVQFFSSLISLLIGISYSWYQKSINFHSLCKIIKEGITLMTLANLILLLAWAFSDILQNNLHTGEYIAYLISGSISLKLLPVIFFLITSTFSIALGSSWAAMMIIIPLAVPLIIVYTGLIPPIDLNNVPILLPTLGAILSGAVTGDHLSPLSCPTIMTTTSSGSALMQHIKTQFVYSLPALTATACAFLVSGFTINYGITLNYILSLLTGFIVLGTLITLFSFYQQYKSSL
ncbi:MAG TPA: Na+/H+ antiporter NhaC family protein [Candidatus Babeliales bacterium]|nr:Na+/H+ antiporter NhaC family protein [Candidatus Babeliales bacterium]